MFKIHSIICDTYLHVFSMRAPYANAKPISRNHIRKVHVTICGVGYTTIVCKKCAKKKVLHFPYKKIETTILLYIFELLNSLTVLYMKNAPRMIILRSNGLAARTTCMMKKKEKSK